MSDDFACSCGPEGKLEMEALHEWVKDTLFKGEWSPAPEFYATALLHQMHAWGADLESVALDQWGMLTVASGDAPMWGAPAFAATVQFDRFEDGLALCLKKFYEHYGPKRARALKETA